ncbi:MAG: DUF503 domain-containing protein [Myxococcota bacterium]
MVVGCLELVLHIPEVYSLKEKRSVVRRAIDRVKNKFDVAIAEVGLNDVHQSAMLGISAVANDQSFVNSVLDKVLAFLEDDLIGRAEVQSSRMELIHW